MLVDSPMEIIAVLTENVLLKMKLLNPEPGTEKNALFKAGVAISATKSTRKHTLF